MSRSRVPLLSQVVVARVVIRFSLVLATMAVAVAVPHLGACPPPSNSPLLRSSAGTVPAPANTQESKGAAGQQCPALRLTPACRVAPCVSLAGPVITLFGSLNASLLSMIMPPLMARARAS